MSKSENIPTPPVPRLTVLAAIDYSGVSEQVVERAVAMTRTAKAGELHFLHVNHGERSREAQEARRSELVAWLEARLLGFNAVPPGVNVVCHEAEGLPQRVIVDMASDLAADLVVMGIHARASAHPTLLGSVSQAVVRDCGCPVLVVRAKQHEHAHSEPPCAPCLEARQRSGGDQLWCEQHAEKHGRCHIRFIPRPIGPAGHRMVC
jgi:nucleotide-binding universal stress UspA family protein